jgi:hypothetical protein
MSRNFNRLGIAFVVMLAALALAASAGAIGRYSDPSGDGNGAPDIQRVDVASDATGQIVFTISVDDLPSPSDVRSFLLLNTDMDPETGAPDSLGSDFVFVLDESDNTYGFAHWNGEEWDWDTPYATVSVSSGRRSAVISVNRSELADTSEFNFWVRTRTGDVSADQADTAPELGAWNYSLAAGGPDIRSIVVQTKPASGPRTGKAFTVTPTALTLPATGEPPSLLPRPDSFSCRAKLAGKALRGHGVGGCTWTIPKKARGRSLVVVVTVAYEGASKSVPFKYRVS